MASEFEGVVKMKEKISLNCELKQQTGNYTFHKNHLLFQMNVSKNEIEKLNRDMYLNFAGRSESSNHNLRTSLTKTVSLKLFLPKNFPIIFLKIFLFC